MQYGYLLKISNKNIYKEVQIPVDAEIMKIGMGIDCDVRFYKESFFEDFELVLQKKLNEWNITCSDNVFIDAGDVRKLITKKLSHGDSFAIKYQKSENEVFKIDFVYDFDNENKDYSRVIDITSKDKITIGNSSRCNICINSEYVKDDFVELNKKNENLILAIKSTTCGVYHNGNLAVNGEVIRNGDFFSIANFSFYYKNGVLRAPKNITVNSLSFIDGKVENNYPKFIRNTRVKTVIDDEKIEVLDPPSKPQKPKTNLLTRLLPSGVMIIMGVAMIAVSPFMLVSSALGVVTAIMSIIESKKEFKKNSAERIEKYNIYIDRKKTEIESEREKERTALEEIYISSQKEQDEFKCFSSDLFDRTPEDEDFLAVRVGTGSKDAIKEITYKKQERLEIEDDLQEIPQQICDEYKKVNNAPIICDFKNANAVGIIGQEQIRYDIMKNIVIDLCARQYQSDLKLFFVTEHNNADKINWLRMLPHLYNDDLGIRNIVSNDESKNIIFEYLYKLLTIREEQKAFDYRIVVFLYDEYGFMNHPISKFVDKAKDLGVAFIFFGNKKSEIQQGCNYLIDITDNSNAVLIDTSDKSKNINFAFKSIADEQAESIVNLLAPVYTEEISLEGTLTKNISLFKLLNILAVDDLNLSLNWNTSQVFKSMAAPIGVSKSGVVFLDLHDKAHGPHGLVAGTTGSGKSEILQTYILSMATLFHPYEVGFVIIDFKGGGMVNQFKDLPHLMGAITNIDGKEINRSLKSIKAELQKRQRYFAEADVNHIDKYIKKYKAGEVSEPLPHLIVIVDEFAELKAEQPEFMKELISAARIGRSLGVHLILATQKPSGQVNEQIWSNSRFKLCLKVQDQQDSNEVLKSPLAAEIKEPGRAYLQVGNNEIFELFQSAYSGAPEKVDNNNVKEFKIFALNDSGRKMPVYEQKKKRKSGEGDLTQLDAIVKYVRNYCDKKAIRKLPDICLPSLEKVINFPNKDSLLPKDYTITTEIGIYDDPDNQYQGTYSIDLANQNVMIIGSAQSGKTNILQTMIRSIASKYTPQEVSIYIMDFASMVLKNFESLNHVGGVVTSSEDEKLKNLMKLLFTEIETRKEKLMSVGVSSFSAYKEAGRKDLPQIVVIIDNLTALKELYFEDDDDLLRLCREGLTVGVTMVMANSQTAGIGYKYLSNFSAKIALFCNDSSEYGSLFEHCRETIDDIHGRCIVEIDKTHLDCQTFLAFEGEKEIDRVKEIKQFVSIINSRNPKLNAQIIPVIPDLLTKDFVDSTLSGFMTEKYSVVIGLDYGTVSPVTLQLNSLGSPLTITGREGMGRHNFFKYILSMLDRKYHNQTDVYVIDSINKRLADVSKTDNINAYEFMPEKAEDIIFSIESELKLRYETLASGDDDVISNSNLIVLIINNREVAEIISNNMNLMNSYKNIISKYKNMNVCVLFGDYENTNISYASPEIVKNIRDARHFLYFDDIANLKILDLPLSVMRQFKKPIDTGDCFYIKDNECIKIKTTLS